MLDAARARGQEQVRAELDRLADTTDPAVRAALVDDIVAAAEPILSVFGERHLAGDARGDDAALLPHPPPHRRRRRRPRRPPAAVGGLPARWSRPRRARDHRAHRARGAGRGRAAAPCSRTCAGSSRGCPADSTVLLDLYVTAGEAPDDDPERSAEKIRESLGTLPAPLDRVAVAVRRAGADERSSWFTFHPDGGPTRAGRGPHAARAAPDGGRAAGAVAAGQLHADPAAVADRRPPVPRRRAATCPTTGGSSRCRTCATCRWSATSRAASAPCRSSSTSSTPAWTPCARPAPAGGHRRAVGLEPGAALRLAGRGPAARRVRQRGQPAGAAHRGAGPGADPRAVPAGPRSSSATARRSRRSCCCGCRGRPGPG